MKNNRFIQEQCQQLSQCCIFDLQYFNFDHDLSEVEQQLKKLDEVSTETSLNNSTDMNRRLK